MIFQQRKYFEVLHNSRLFRVLQKLMPTFLTCSVRPTLRKKTLITCYVWFTTAMTCYGLTLNAGTLVPDLGARSPGTP